jgi:hypothetical protein
MGGPGSDQFFIETAGRLDGQIDAGGTNTLFYSSHTMGCGGRSPAPQRHRDWPRRVSYQNVTGSQGNSHLVSNGKSDARLNGTYVLNKQTVLSDGAIDSLAAGA